MSICLGYQAVYRDKRESSSSLTTQLLALFLLFVSLSFKIWVKLEVVELGYQIAEVQSESVRLDLERQDLELQYSVLTRFDQLGNRAAARLELFPPAPDKVTIIKERA